MTGGGLGQQRAELFRDSLFFHHWSGSFPRAQGRPLRNQVRDLSGAPHHLLNFLPVFGGISYVISPVSPHGNKSSFPFPLQPGHSTWPGLLGSEVATREDSGVASVGAAELSACGWGAGWPQCLGLQVGAGPRHCGGPGPRWSHQASPWCISSTALNGQMGPVPVND